MGFVGVVPQTAWTDMTGGKISAMTVSEMQPFGALPAVRPKVGQNARCQSPASVTIPQQPEEIVQTHIGKPETASTGFRELDHTPVSF